jgi:kynureninase
LLPKLEPKITGWAGHAAPFAFELGEQRFAPDARRMLNGSPAVPALLAATAGYETILEVGVERIHQHSVLLTEWLRQELLARGFAVTSPTDPARRGGSLTVKLGEGESGPAFVAALEQRGVLVDHRPDAGLRVSPHFYTKLEELRRFADLLVELRTGGAWRAHVDAKKSY